MLTIKKTKRITINEPVEVLRVRRLNPVSKNLQNLKCTACGQKIGNREWGSAWVKQGNIKRGLRLCKDCLDIAEADCGQQNNL